MALRLFEMVGKAGRLASYLWRPGPREVKWAVESLLIEHGHARSIREGRPVDKDGRPLPWYTYPAITYLDSVDLRDKHVFEFGSGNSSLFWAARTASVTSVEHDRPWFEHVLANRRPNQDLRFVESGDAYVDSVRADGRKYDVIVVDGERRKACARAALDCLADDGMIVFDNTDWFPRSAAILRDADLIEVDFTGFGPGNQYVWTTSLFMRRGVRIRPSGDRMPAYGAGSLRHTNVDD